MGRRQSFRFLALVMFVGGGGVDRYCKCLYFRPSPFRQCPLLLSKPFLLHKRYEILSLGEFSKVMQSLDERLGFA